MADGGDGIRVVGIKKKNLLEAALRYVVLAEFIRDLTFTKELLDLVLPG